jgi:hypothetical protein
MSQRVLIQHSTGSKASTVEEFPISAAQELTFGRDISCNVRFDKDRDEFVSRRHMKLVADDPDRLEFTVVELNARNGTFVNRRRVKGPTRLRPGDVVQLGAGGPEFVFDCEPIDLKVTPLADVAPIDDETPLPAAPEGTPPPVPVPAPAADERKRPRAVRPKVRRANRKNWIAGVAILALVAIGAVAYVTGTASAVIQRGGSLFRSDPALSPADIAARNAPSLTSVVNTWRLVEAGSGRPLRQIYIANRQDSGAPLIPTAGAELPVFVLVASNRLQPLLTLAGDQKYRSIGGRHTATGFTIGSDGLVLTTRAAAAPWSAPYEWPESESAGVVVTFDAQSKLARTAVIARRQFPRWIPTDTDFVLGGAFDQDSAGVNRRVRGTGRTDALTVGSSAASVVRITDDTDLATLRPKAAASPKVNIAAADLKSGDEVVLVGPAGQRSGTGQLSLLVDGRYGLLLGPETTATPGAPVFDRHGRAVAVQTEVDQLHPGRAVAVPIRRALESVGQ